MIPGCLALRQSSSSSENMQFLAASAIVHNTVIPQPYSVVTHLEMYKQHLLG